MGRLLKIFRWLHVTPEMLSGYLDSTLGEGDRQRVDDHLEACWRCRRDLLGVQEIVRLFRSMPVVSVPRSFALLAPVEIVRPALSFPGRASWVAAVAVAVALVVVLVGDGVGFLGPKSPQASVHLALAEPAPIVRSDLRNGPEAAVPVRAPSARVQSAQAQAQAQAQAPAASAMKTGGGVTPPLAVEVSARGGSPFDLWVWEIGLLGVLGLLVLGGWLLRRATWRTA